MEKAVLLALAASFCTATASVCQRLGARSYERADFDVWLVFRLARRPVWLLGLASMILGFVFQISALRFGPLALVQPVLALELLLVFGFMTVIGRRVRVRHIAWLAHRTLPYALSRAGEAPAAVRCSLTAPDEVTTWTFGPDEADSQISGSARAFCRVAAQRLDPADSGLRATGPHGATALHVVRTYA